MPTGILRFVYALNVIIPSTVGLIHLASPSLAADRLWDGLARPSLAMPMLGSVWLAVGFLSLLGLRSADPLRFRCAQLGCQGKRSPCGVCCLGACSRAHSTQRPAGCVHVCAHSLLFRSPCPGGRTTAYATTRRWQPALLVFRWLERALLRPSPPAPL